MSSESAEPYTYSRSFDDEAADSFNMFLSGGGLRSALSAIGTIAYLVKTDRWRHVRAIASVSGGTFTNMAMAAAATKDADETLHTLVDRLVTNPPARRMRRTLTGLVFSVVGFCAAVFIGSALSDGVVVHRRTAVVLVVVWVASGLVLVPKSREIVRAHMIVQTIGFLLVGFGSMLRIRHPLLCVVVLAIGGCIVLATAVFFLLDLFLVDRVRSIVGELPANWSFETGGRVHVFATSDTTYGTPIYIAACDGEHRVFRPNPYDQVPPVLDEIHEMSLVPFTAMLASVALPGVEAPVRRPVGSSVYRLSDGGLHGTLASQLDPFLSRGRDGQAGDLCLLIRSMSGKVGTHSIVVDAGKFIRRESWVRAADFPVTGRLFDVFRAFLISLDALITENRNDAIDATSNADAESTSTWHWYLRTTGGSVPDHITRGDRADPEIASRVSELRTRADRVGLFGGFRDNGRDCVRVGAFTAWLAEREAVARGAVLSPHAPSSLEAFDKWFDGWLRVGEQAQPRRASPLRRLWLR